MGTIHKPWPPGIIYLIQHIPQILLSPISSFFVLKLSQTIYDFELKTWVIVVLFILSGPVIFGILLAWDDLKNYRAARAVGAVLPSRHPDWSPGSVYTVWKRIRKERKQYIGEILFLFLHRVILMNSNCASLFFFFFFSGDGFDRQAERCGCYVFNSRILFQNRVSPAG